MKKQTAVEWLFEQVANLDWRNLQGDKKLEIFNQAKAMEKMQMIEYSKNCIEYVLNIEITASSMEEHYNETYGK